MPSICSNKPIWKYYTEYDATIDVVCAYTFFACSLSQVFTFVRESTSDTIQFENVIFSLFWNHKINLGRICNHSEAARDFDFYERNHKCALTLKNHTNIVIRLKYYTRVLNILNYKGKCKLFNKRAIYIY